MERTIDLKIEIPEGITETEEAALLAKAREGAILALFEANSISARQAAKALGLTLYDFLEFLAKKGIPCLRGEIISSIKIAKYSCISACQEPPTPAASKLPG